MGRGAGRIPWGRGQTTGADRKRRKHRTGGGAKGGGPHEGRSAGGQGGGPRDDADALRRRATAGQTRNSNHTRGAGLGRSRRQGEPRGEPDRRTVAGQGRPDRGRPRGGAPTGGPRSASGDAEDGGGGDCETGGDHDRSKVPTGGVRRDEADKGKKPRTAPTERRHTSWRAAAVRRWTRKGQRRAHRIPQRNTPVRTLV